MISDMIHAAILLVASFPVLTIASFDPDLRNLESYGIRIAGNNDLFAHANSQDRLFIVQLAPYNDTNNRQQCSVPYSDRSHYVYTIGLGSRQNITDGPFFYYAGEVVPTDSTGADRSGKNGTFIAMMINRQPALKPPAGCPYFKPESIAYLSSYDHQEHFVIAVEPLGRFAIGLARDFVFRYEPFSDNTMRSKSTEPCGRAIPCFIRAQPMRARNSPLSPASRRTRHNRKRAPHRPSMFSPTIS